MKRRSNISRICFVCIIFLSALVLAGLSRPATAAGAAITIDAGKTGEPISKYIYGQFIEHLGHRIYGGIWADKLNVPPMSISIYEFKTMN